MRKSGTSTPYRDEETGPRTAFDARIGQKGETAGQTPYCADFLPLVHDEMLSAARASFSGWLCTYVRIVNAVSACPSQAEMIATGTLCSRCMSVPQVSGRRATGCALRPRLRTRCRPVIGHRVGVVARWVDDDVAAAAISGPAASCSTACMRVAALSTASSPGVSGSTRAPLPQLSETRKSRCATVIRLHPMRSVAPQSTSARLRGGTALISGVGDTRRHFISPGRGHDPSPGDPRHIGRYAAVTPRSLLVHFTHPM